MKVINAEGMILGRLATILAKKALLNEEIVVVNCNEMVVSGKKAKIIEEITQKRDRGTPAKGPFYPRYPELILKRVVRGMLPWDTNRGREAFKRVICFRDIPLEYEKAEFFKIEDENIYFKKLPNMKFIKLSNLSTILGGKI